MRKVLLVAFHYPPCTGSSGVQRAARFAQYLPEFGWQPTILTASTGAYERLEGTGTTDIEIPVHRALALDSARHLSLFGRYPAFIARPDRWISWWPFAVWKGLQIIRRTRPTALWSTYPIPTAHLIGHSLQRLTGIPWIADFRDPMAHEGYPSDPRLWRTFASIERKVFAHATLATFTTPGTRKLYRDRYLWQDERLDVIENGFDEGVFENARKHAAQLPTSSERILLHSGVVYPEWRNPHNLFRALRALLEEGVPAAESIRIRFRAPAHEAFLAALAKAENIESRVEILPPVPHETAVAEMLTAQGLLLLQNAGCNDQVPAKVYEYLRTGVPILALVAPAGDTAATLSSHGQQVIQTDIESQTEVKQALMRWLTMPCLSTRFESEASYPHSRRGSAEKLAESLDKAVAISMQASTNGIPNRTQSD